MVRREHGVLRRYCHIGTGNYNPKTARIYEDLGILTADPRVGADLTDLFNTLTGYSRQTNYRTLMVAPHGIRTGLIEKIRREARHAAEGRPSGIRFKLNSLVDERIIDALYEASAAGVPVELLIRGICALRPGRPGPVGEHPGALDRRPLPRALPRDVLPQRRRAASGGWAAPTSCTATSTAGSRCCCGSATRPPARELHRIFDAAMAPDVRCWELGSDGAWTRTRTAGTTRPSCWSASVSSPADAAGRTSSPRPAARSGAGRAGRRPGGRRSCTGRATTTGRCPRASSTPASTR